MSAIVHLTYILSISPGKIVQEGCVFFKKKKFHYNDYTSHFSKEFIVDQRTTLVLIEDAEDKFDLFTGPIHTTFYNVMNMRVK